MNLKWYIPKYKFQIQHKNRIWNLLFIISLIIILRLLHWVIRIVTSADLHLVFEDFKLGIRSSFGPLIVFRINIRSLQVRIHDDAFHLFILDKSLGNFILVFTPYICRNSLYL